MLRNPPLAFMMLRNSPLAFAMLRNPPLALRLAAPFKKWASLLARLTKFAKRRQKTDERDKSTGETALKKIYYLTNNARLQSNLFSFFNNIKQHFTTRMALHEIDATLFDGFKKNWVFDLMYINFTLSVDKALI